jgi:hypothetical protein
VFPSVLAASGAGWKLCAGWKLLAASGVGWKLLVATDGLEFAFFCQFVNSHKVSHSMKNIN